VSRLLEDKKRGLTLTLGLEILSLGLEKGLIILYLWIFQNAVCVFS